jgi:hypothetical protein
MVKKVSATKQRRGRPSLPLEERKRYPLNMRATKELREKMEGAAHVSGRSLAQEVEFRLERSFMDDERFAALMGEDGGEMAQLFGAAIRTARLLAKTKKPYREDPANYALVERAIQGILAHLRPGEPSEEDGKIAQWAGKKIADMHVENRSKEIAAQLGGEWSALRPSTKDSE